jgi:outer membrane protein assembly factor BamB
MFVALVLGNVVYGQRVQIRPGREIRIFRGGLQFGQFRPTPRQIELTPAHVDTVSGNTANRLEQVRALIGDKNWDEAVDILRELAADTTDRVVALDGERYISLRTYCQWKLAHLPADALAAYRRRVDALAGHWYRDGVANRDQVLLRRIVDELFCSSWGDDALMALGEFALERGDYAAARRYWEQMSPLTRDPNGKPLWLSLRDVDLDKYWPVIEQRWPRRTQSPAWLAYPDTDISLADIRARLVLVSIRAGDLDRAAVELDAFRRWHPDATGRLGGQEGSLAPALERLLASAREWPATPPDRNWPTFAGAQSRSPNAASIGSLAKTSWADPVSLPVSTVGRNRSTPQSNHQQQPQVRESERPLSYYPVVVDGLLLYAGAATLNAVSLSTGQPAVTPDGTLFRVEATPGNANWAVQRARSYVHGVPRFSLTVIDGVAYARVGPATTTRLNPGTRPVAEKLVGLDLKRDGLLTFQARPDDDSWSFDGAPVGDGRRLFIAMRHGDVTPHAYVACFDVATRNRLWRTSIGSADTIAVSGAEITHNLLTLVGDRVYFNTNLGLVAALDTETGRIEWLRRYERGPDVPSATGLGLPLHFDRDPSPCLVHAGMVVVAPWDTPNVFALDANTGRLIWSTNQLADALHLLGVVGNSLVATGNRVWSLDIRTGQVRFAWPESIHAGIRGMGRGVLAGNEIFWPTRKEIFFFDARTGTRTRSPVDLSFISDSGANLIAASGYLIVVGHDKMIAAGPAALPSDEENPPPQVAEAN